VSVRDCCVIGLVGRVVGVAGGVATWVVGIVGVSPISSGLVETWTGMVLDSWSFCLIKLQRVCCRGQRGGFRLRLLAVGFTLGGVLQDRCARVAGGGFIMLAQCRSLALGKACCRGVSGV